jgi:hypothetical protein
MVKQGKGVVVEGEATDGDVTVVTTGATGLDPMVSAMADVIGTAAPELMPRLPISVDARGIPVLATPPETTGAVDVGVDIGVEDEAMLPEPAPHIPDMPEVSSIPAVVGTPDDIEIPAGAAGCASPRDMPPPSKLAVDPTIEDGALPSVEHVAPLDAAMVPVASAGAGLMPGETISVEPSGMPVGETGETAAMPSGDVVPMVGAGMSIPATCAMATLPMNSIGMTAASNENLRGPFGFPTASRRRAPVSFAIVTLGARLWDIAQFLGGDTRRASNGRRRQVFNFLSGANANFGCLASCDWSQLSLQSGRWFFRVTVQLNSDLWSGADEEQIRKSSDQS